MPVVAERADALRIKLTSALEVQHLTSLRVIPGVVLKFVAGLNGVGTGQIRSEGDGTLLSWRAPGSTLFGASVACGADGEYALEDGTDLDSYVRVEVFNADLIAGATSAAVYLKDVWGNIIGGDDITSGEATAGDVSSVPVRIENVSSFTLSRIRVWLDADNSAGLAISDDDATWVSPITDATALELPDLDPGAFDLFYIQRTITAGATANPEVLNVLRLSHEGI